MKDGGIISENTKYYLKAALCVVVFIAVYNLLDLLWAAVITKSPYVFSPMSDLMVPIVIALVFYFVTYKKGKK